MESAQFIKAEGQAASEHPGRQSSVFSQARCLPTQKLPL